MADYGKPDVAVAGQIDSLHWETDSMVAGESINPGAPVFGYVGDTTQTAYGFKVDTAKVVYSADFVASNSIAFTVNGTSITPVVYGTSHAATMTALIAAINGLTGVVAIADSPDTNNRTILVRTKGATNTTTSAVTLGATQATVTVTTGSAQIFRGVAKYAPRVPATIGGTASFVQYESVPVVRLADVWVPADSGVEAMENVYITSTGTFGVSGVSVGRAVASRDSTTALALVRLVSAPVPMAYGDRF